MYRLSKNLRNTKAAYGPPIIAKKILFAEVGHEFGAIKSHMIAEPIPIKYPIKSIMFRFERLLRAKDFASSVLDATSGAMYGMNKSQKLLIDGDG
jgi:hypothetical protein